MTFYAFPNGEIHDLLHEPRDPAARKLTKTEGKKARADYCRRVLLEMIQPGAEVYTQLHHVSASGMSRRISLHIVHEGRIRCIDTLAADLMGSSLHPKGGISVSGCGMDMGFHLVYTLGHYLWPTGTPAPHGTRNGEPDSAGGYALKHSWL